MTGDVTEMTLIGLLQQHSKLLGVTFWRRRRNNFIVQPWGNLHITTASRAAKSTVRVFVKCKDPVMGECFIHFCILSMHLSRTVLVEGKELLSTPTVSCRGWRELSRGWIRRRKENVSKADVLLSPNISTESRGHPRTELDLRTSLPIFLLSFSGAYTSPADNCVEDSRCYDSHRRALVGSCTLRRTSVSSVEATLAPLVQDVSICGPVQFVV